MPSDRSIPGAEFAHAAPRLCHRKSKSRNLLDGAGLLTGATRSPIVAPAERVRSLSPRRSATSRFFGISSLPLGVVVPGRRLP
jgi:hypothetical protein